MEEKFLGKFPILGRTGWDTTKILYLSSEDRKYQTDLTTNLFPDEEIHITSAISHEGLDKSLQQRLLLMRDLYNEILKRFAQDNMLDLTTTGRVLEPRFRLTSLCEGLSSKAFERDYDEFRKAYTELTNDLINKFGIKNTAVKGDWLHFERIVLPVFEHYSLQLVKPTNHVNTFEVCADNHSDYARLTELSKILADKAKVHLEGLIKVYDKDYYTTCSFGIDLDIRKNKELAASVFERLLLKA